MTKESKKRLMITSIVTLLPIVIGIVLWNRLPEQLATHFDSYGEPNGWSSKTFSVFGLPLFLLLINIICCVTTESDPRRSRYPKKMMRMIYWIIPVVSWFGSLSIYGYSLGVRFENTGRWISLFIGAMFFVIGNYLPKVKQNFFLGIKLPWTYTDEDNWNKTHRFAGRLWVVGGLLIMLNAFFGIHNLEIVMAFVLVAVPTVYSWLYFMKKNRKKEGNEE